MCLYPCRTETRAIHSALGSSGPIGAVLSASSGCVPARLCVYAVGVNAPPCLELASIYPDLLLV